MKDQEQAPEFSRIVRADSVQRDRVVETIEATEAERAALAKRFELEAIDRLTATVELRRARGGEMVSVTGELDADVVQTCVVTLEPVKAHVRDRFEALFAPDHLIPEEDDEMEFDLAALEEDVPEPMPGGRIDIGELAAQHLSLALDPYPRAPGIELEVFEHDDESAAAPAKAEPERPNPFAVLERLKRPH